MFALLWTFPCLQCGPSIVSPHAFHVMAGFVLAALLVVCGFMFGPTADPGHKMMRAVLTLSVPRQV